MGPPSLSVRSGATVATRGGRVDRPKPSCPTPWRAQTDGRVAVSLTGEPDGWCEMDVASVLTLALLALFLAAQPWSVLAAVLLVTARRWVEEGACLRRRLGLRPRGCRGGDVVGLSGLLAHVDGQPGHAAVELAVGLLLGGWLLTRWRHPKDPGTNSQPSWMGRLDAMSPLLAFGLGAFLPTYAVVVAAVSEMLSSGLTRGWLAAVAAAWVVLASSRGRLAAGGARGRPGPCT